MFTIFPYLITPTFADKSEGAWGLGAWLFESGWKARGGLGRELLLVMVLAAAK